MQATAKASPNIALIKYWGKLDNALNIPAVGSISITLDSLWTKTQVTVSEDIKRDDFILNGEAQLSELPRISACLDLLRGLANTTKRIRVESICNFPVAAGLASSASGFAALVLAASNALGLDLNIRELAIIARMASGSSARSLFGGFVEMLTGSHSRDFYPIELLPAAAWPLKVLVAVTSGAKKKVGSTVGMVHSANTSPFYNSWVATQQHDLEVARNAINSRDFLALAAISEYSCLKMHAVMLASNPGLIYWNGATVECLHVVRELRQQGEEVFFTVDAGPQVKCIVTEKSLAKVTAALAAVKGVQQVLQSDLGIGAISCQGFSNED